MACYTELTVFFTSSFWIAKMAGAGEIVLLPIKAGMVLSTFVPISEERERERERERDSCQRGLSSGRRRLTERGPARRLRPPPGSAGHPQRPVLAARGQLAHAGRCRQQAP